MNQYTGQNGKTATGRLHCPHCRSEQQRAVHCGNEDNAAVNSSLLYLSHCSLEA